MLRMFLFANSSMHPACTPPKTVIGTPASKVKASWAVLIIVKSAAPRALISAPGLCVGSFGSAYVRLGKIYIADIGKAVETQQLLGDPLRRDADEARAIHDPDRGRFRRRLGHGRTR